MKTLFELAKFNKDNVKIIELLIPSEKFSPLKKLFSIVFSGKIIEDNQAMLIIYGKTNLATFSRLKTRLKEILITATLLKSNYLESKHSRANESWTQFRHALVVRLFKDVKITQLAISIAERTLVKSIKSDSTENILLLTRLLIRHYGAGEYNKYKLNSYLNIQQKYLRIHSLEIKVENYYNELQQIQLHSFAEPTDIIKDLAKKYISEIEEIKDIRTYFFNLYKYKLKNIYYEYEKDFRSILNLSDETIKELRSVDQLSKSALHTINMRKVWALIQIGNFKEAVNMSLKDMKSLPSGSLAWYFIGYYRLKALLYKGDFEAVVDLIKLLLENHGFSKIGSNHKELFYTALGYIHLIVDSGLAGDREKYHKKLPEFRIGKFLNTTPVFSKDKRGINVSILLMHVAFLLQRKNYNAIIDRIDSLKNYVHKYLRNDDTFRSNCMIKMVIQMTKADFNPIRTERYTRDLLYQLEQVKLAGSGQNIETEIIPYEVLWSIMKKSL